jgi:hypothetical protein
MSKMNFIFRKATFPHLFVLILWLNHIYRPTTGNLIMNKITEQWANLEYSNNITGCDALLVSAPEYGGA